MQKQFQSLLLEPVVPDGANKEINDGVGTAVNTGQKYYHINITNINKLQTPKQLVEEKVDAQGETKDQEEEHCEYNDHTQPGYRNPL